MPYIYVNYVVHMLFIFPVILKFSKKCIRNLSINLKKSANLSFNMPPPGKKNSIALLKKYYSYFKAEHFADNVIPTNREVANSIIFFKEKHTAKESVSTVSTLIWAGKLKLNSVHQTRLQLMSSISIGILHLSIRNK